MKTVCTRFSVCLPLLALGLFPVLASGQKPVASKTATIPKASLPPVSWTCPMDPEIVEDKAGRCPKCGMPLTAGRLDEAYSCPLHPQILETKPGRCPIDKQELVRITVSLFWTCPGSDTHELSPGRCPDGTPRKETRERRAHGDHNPRHGGMFFMASDNWHHIEGTYPRAGLFRVFFYNDFTQPLPTNGVEARAVTKETFDPATRKTTEIEVFPLRPSKDGRSLEAQIPGGTLPQNVIAKVKFDGKSQEFRFDFAFPELSKEPATAKVLMTTAAPAPAGSKTAARPPAASAAKAPAPAASSPSPAGGAMAFGAMPASTPPPPAVIANLPTTTEGLLTELRARSAEVNDLLQQGAYGQVYVPALASKELALALGDKVAELPDGIRLQVTVAVKQTVLAAWLLDQYGDLGDKEKLTGAYQTFADGVKGITTAYAAR